MSDLATVAALFVAGFVAGGINAIAGGGTSLTFALLATILPPGPGRLVAANVTSKIGLWPGAAAAAWASRAARGSQPAWARGLLLPSVVGAVIGVALLQQLPKDSFDAVVPWLILLAAVLFAVQPQVARLAGRPHQPERAGVGSGRLLAVGMLQLLVGIYGGYFGAGIGVLMLAVLAVLGLDDIHALNATKNLLAAAINGVATAALVAVSLFGGFEVSWPHVAMLAAGSVAGGIAVARLALRLPPAAVRRLVAVIAFGLAGYHFWKEWSG
jgi:uncharacterized membrane protein YfcA